MAHTCDVVTTLEFVDEVATRVAALPALLLMHIRRELRELPVV